MRIGNSGLPSEQELGFKLVGAFPGFLCGRFEGCQRSKLEWRRYTMKSRARHGMLRC